MHPANPCEDEESGSSSDSGRSSCSIHIKEVASNWDPSVVSLTSVDEGAFNYLHIDQLPLRIVI